MYAYPFPLSSMYKFIGKVLISFLIIGFVAGMATAAYDQYSLYHRSAMFQAR